MRMFGQCENVLRIFAYVGGICDAVSADCCVRLIVNSDKVDKWHSQQHSLCPKWPYDWGENTQLQADVSDET